MNHLQSFHPLIKDWCSLKGISILIFLLAFQNVFAQRTIQGSISDNFNQPLFGASIISIDKSVGTTSDIDGYFELEIPEDVSGLSLIHI